MINKDRIRFLNSNAVKTGNYVLYWMQSSQRTEFNHALEYAIEQSNKYNQPLLAVFCLVDNYPRANISHYRFMLQGLYEVKESLKKRGIGFAIHHGDPKKIIPSLSTDASLVVVDRDYQQNQRNWRRKVAQSLECPLIQVESNVIVPIETVSQKEEYSAGTIRPKISKVLDKYLTPLQKRRVKNVYEDIGLDGIQFTDVEDVLMKLRIKNQKPQKIRFQGGLTSARQLLRNFICNDLVVFETLRNDPAEDRLSNMSPFLHFGQISPLEIALEILNSNSPGSESYLEELIVRRELSMNFVFFNENYDNIECLPNWAKETLDLHSMDLREYTYKLNDLERAKTHDSYWNAAQKEMTVYGKMHGYMRMYWGKKIIEWSDSPEEAYNTCITLNDKYELDGRDSNGYAGIAWCFGKHDRAWKEREIFGKVRYMNANGLRRKFDIEMYVKRISE
ncbi:MAG: deoxyribodipyrimidine photolyase [Candidatus Thorarchaeota archaeon SMTZ-45]|nr:MAG: deoxyribodipyrimidine photolyase [Candidatus Thorarchaeota archaeon SMTZ1-45]KXH77089.1 MAG: deoxyribodipyrimidine photolyase [Candidatus Thorarchaeota archaeon SMTZ-45]